MPDIRLLAILSLCLLVPIPFVQAQSLRPNVARWIDRPWEYRYLLYTRTSHVWQLSKGRFERSLAADPAKAREFGDPIEAHFQPQLSLPLPDSDTGQLNPRYFLEVLRLDIAPDRTVVQPTVDGKHLRARLNWLQDIVLTPSDESPLYVIDFGFLFMGAAGATDPRYSPAICSLLHGDSTPVDGPGHRYHPTFTPSIEGYFGCREWAAQLFDKNRPYIDVTSYETVQDTSKPKGKNGKHPLKPATYLRPFVGFSRFGDAPKPVIGSHMGHWFCISDCPDGAPAGPIEDIQAWSAKHGWPSPSRPSNVREFADRVPEVD